jgi:hypothetical protein
MVPRYGQRDFSVEEPPQVAKGFEKLVSVEE